MKKGDRYVVNGQKVWISRIQHSDLMILLARTTPVTEVKRKSEGMSIFIVDLQQAIGNGLTLQPIRNMVNHETCELFFDNLEIPAENLIGEEGKGFKYILDGLNAERILIAAECIGDAYWFIDRAANTPRSASCSTGRSARTRACRSRSPRPTSRSRRPNLMRFKACALFDAHQPCGAEANMAKYLAAKASWEAANICLQTHGGYGFACEYDVERKFRETRLYSGRADLDQPDPVLRRRARARPAAVVLMSRPLEGLLVLSLEQAVAAPYCTSRLADAGARVIKIERAEGDFARGYDRAAGDVSSYFVWLNRGKQSLVADIKQPGDAALLHAILARADVFIQNLAPGAAARAGFGSDALRARHPRLITVDISGYGDTGDYAAMKAYDLLVQAEIGPGDDHRPSGRPGPRRRLGLRHRLRHGGARRGAGGADRARQHRARQRPEGQPVRRHGRLDERAAAVLRGHRHRAPAHGARAPVDLPVRRIRHQRRRAGADLDPERTRMGRVLRTLSGRAGPAGSRASRPTSSASPTAPRSTRTSPRPSRG